MVLTAGDKAVLQLAARSRNSCVRALAPRLDELERTNDVELLQELLDEMKLITAPIDRLQETAPHLFFPDPLAAMRTRLLVKKKALLG